MLSKDSTHDSTQQVPALQEKWRGDEGNRIWIFSSPNPHTHAHGAGPDPKSVNFIVAARTACRHPTAPTAASRNRRLRSTWRDRSHADRPSPGITKLLLVRVGYQWGSWSAMFCFRIPAAL